MTKEEQKAYMKEYRILNKKKISEYQKKYREAHKEENKAYFKKYHESYYEKNKEKINEYSKKYRKENKEKIIEYRKKYEEEHKIEIQLRKHKYGIENRQKRTEYERKRREEPLYRLKVNIRTLIRNSIKCKEHRKNTKTELILGCSIDEFIEYIQSKFKDGMTLENHGEWHIDHIIPVASATTEEELIKLNHYTNLQPLWAKENLKKGRKIL